MRDLFQKFANALPPLTDREVDLYVEHFDLLKKWNERMGLVSRKSIDRSFAIHYADSLIIADFANRHCPDGDVYDLGTGAGFPGVIFAIRYPQRRITLFEKMLKKQTFLTAALTHLKLENAVLAGAMPGEKRSGLFLGRAVMPRDELFPFMRERMSMGSSLVTNLGGGPEAPEPTEPPRAFEIVADERYVLPGDGGDRRVQIHRFVPRGTTQGE